MFSQFNWSQDEMRFGIEMRFSSLSEDMNRQGLAKVYGDRIAASKNALIRQVSESGDFPQGSSIVDTTIQKYYRAIRRDSPVLNFYAAMRVSLLEQGLISKTDGLQFDVEDLGDTLKERNYRINVYRIQ